MWSTGEEDRRRRHAEEHAEHVDVGCEERRRRK
jgi:hypothetical protein